MRILAKAVLAVATASWLALAAAWSQSTTQRVEPKPPETGAEMSFHLTLIDEPTGCVAQLPAFSGSFKHENGKLHLKISEGMTLKGAPLNRARRAWDLRFGTEFCEVQVYIGLPDKTR